MVWSSNELQHGLDFKHLSRCTEDKHLLKGSSELEALAFPWEGLERIFQSLPMDQQQEMSMETLWINHQNDQAENTASHLFKLNNKV